MVCLVAYMYIITFQSYYFGFHFTLLWVKSVVFPWLHHLRWNLWFLSNSFWYSQVALGGTSGKGPACQCRRCKRTGFDLWAGKVPWRRARQPIPVFLTESHGQKSLVGCSPWGHTKSDTTKQLSTHALLLALGLFLWWQLLSFLVPLTQLVLSAW